MAPSTRQRPGETAEHNHGLHVGYIYQVNWARMQRSLARQRQACSEWQGASVGDQRLTIAECLSSLATWRNMTNQATWPLPRGWICTSGEGQLKAQVNVRRPRSVEGISWQSTSKGKVESLRACTECRVSISRDGDFAFLALGEVWPRVWWVP
jgi:hypothetical protein